MKQTINSETDDKCPKCKKDWTKCNKCPVMIEWVKEHRKEHAESEEE